METFFDQHFLQNRKNYKIGKTNGYTERDNLQCCFGNPSREITQTHSKDT